MMATSLQHLSIATIAIVPIVFFQWCLQRCVPFDASIRYAVGRWLIVVLLCLVPVQVLWVQHGRKWPLTRIECTQP